MATKLLNAEQEAELNASRATTAHIDENISIINDFPAILANYNAIKANEAAILEAIETKGASRLTASQKKDLRTRLSDKILTFAGVVETFADDNNDLQLRDDMHVTKTQLRHIRDDEFAPFCQFIHTRASAHSAALKDYNIQPADFTELQTLITEYQMESPKPRTATSQRKTINANLVALFADNKRRYKNLDKQIKTLITQSPDFVNTYFNARKIYDPPTRPEEKEDENNGNPV